MRQGLSRQVAVAIAIAVSTIGLGQTAVNAATSNPAAKECKNDPGVSASEIKVGGLYPTSGPSAQSFAAAGDGIQARFAKANAEGELGNRKLTLIPADDAADPARNISAAQQLVEKDGVFGIIEVTNASDASGEYLNKAKIPVSGWHVGNVAWGTYKNMFSFRNSVTTDPENVYATRLGDVVKSYGGKKVAVVGQSSASSSTFVNQSEKSMKSAGLKVVYKTTALTPSDRDFTAVAEKIKESGADSVVTGMDLVQNAALNQALNQANYPLKVVIFPGGYDKRAVGIEGMEGVVFSVEFKPFEENPPAFIDYEKWMKQELPDKPYLGQVPYIGWLSAETFIEGIKAAGVECPTRAAFIKNLRKEKGYDANGAFEPVDFAKVFGNPLLCAFYVKVENGAFVPQFEGKPFCTKAIVTNGKVKNLTPADIKGA